MSTVYLGTDEVLDRPVAVKVLKSEFVGSDIGARFRREGRTAARLSHPNIVQTYDAGEDDLDGENVSYIVMEHVSGGDLRDLIHERGTLSAEEISNLTGVAAGLAHAHERGVVHRDIKPHNILLDGNGQPKLADFGIARALDATRATRTGTYMGTARYSSPEQLQGKEITPKSDIYSLGAMLYEAATGDPPFDGTPIEVASQHVSKPPTPPGELALVDEKLEALILACLAKNPEDRPTATEVRSRLAEVGTYAEAPPAATETVASAGSGTAGPQTISRRAPLLVALVAVLVLLGALGAFVFAGDDGQQAQGPAGTTRGPTAAPVPEPVPEPSPSTVKEVPETAPPPTTAQQEAPPVPEDVEQSGGDPAEQSAARAVREAYELAAAGEYEESYEFLSPAFRQSLAPTQAAWTNQFDTLERIRWLEGPDAQVTGDAARVEGVTLAEHTDKTERNTVTWTLVRQGGEWKLNSINSIYTELV